MTILFRHEMKKIISSVAVWTFITLCLLFNILTLADESGFAYADFVGGISKVAGIGLGDKFNEALENISVNEANRQYMDLLQAETSGMCWKVIPVFVAFAFVCAFIYPNLLLLHNLLTLAWSEIAVCASVFLLGLAAALLVVRREKRIDIVK